MSPQPAPVPPPEFFIVGCVRSGTTFLRDLFRRYPGLICPEETHFFRNGDPFRCGATFRDLRDNPVLRKHRELDGVPEDAFRTLLHLSADRADLQRRYIAAYAEARGMSDYRWFDKTPQNIYGVPLIAGQFPKSKFVFLVRNPLDVVASLKLGKVIKVADIHGACNYWLEACTIIRSLAPALGRRLVIVQYEDLVADVPGTMSDLAAVLGLEQQDCFRKDDARPVIEPWRQGLDAEEADMVRFRCADLALGFGYDLRDGSADS